MKSGKLSPIKKTFNSAFKSMEGSLHDAGFFRAPGTTRVYTPYMDATGNYRTGLDPKAPWLFKLQNSSPERYKEEVSWIEQATKLLKQFFGDNIDLGPKASIWKAYPPDNEIGIHVSPVKASNQDIFLDITNDGEALLNYCWLRVHPSIASSMEAYQRGEFPDAQYYIADDEAENKLTYQRKKLVNNAIVSFEKMTPTKQRQVARLMGLPVGDNTTEETIYNLMDSALKQSEFKDGRHKGLSTVNVFNDISKLSDDRISVSDLVDQALNFNIYRAGMGGKIQEGGQTIATNKDELLEFLLDDKNQKDRLALEKKVASRKAE